MATRADDFHVVWATLKQFESCATAASLHDAAMSAMSVYGYAHMSVRAAESTTNKRSTLDRTLLCSWPKGWSERYHGEGFARHDPVVTKLRRVDRSFRWNEATPRTALERRTMDIAREDHRLAHGICVPVRNFEGLYAAVSFAGDNVDDAGNSRFVAELIALYAFKQLTQVQGRTTPRRTLTVRQREIMTWVAAGKTAWDTGAILGISVNTVNKTIANAMLRLNAHTRAQAVIEAIRRGEITP